MRSGAIVAVATMLAGCAPEVSAPRHDLPAMRMTSVQNMFDVALPEGFTVVQKQDTPEDFMLFEVRRGRVPYVGIYAGNAPSFDESGKSGSVHTDLLRWRKLLVSEVDGRKRIGQYLIWAHFSDWPTFLHIWVHDLPSEQAIIAERIAASVRSD